MVLVFDLAVPIRIPIRPSYTLSYDHHRGRSNFRSIPPVLLPVLVQNGFKDPPPSKLLSSLYRMQEKALILGNSKAEDQMKVQQVILWIKPI